MLRTGVLVALMLTAWALAAPSQAQDGPRFSDELLLEGEWLSDHEVRLEWDRPRYPVLLERKLEDDLFFQQIGRFETQDEYRDTSLKVNTTYLYRLRPDPAYYLDEYGPSLSMRYEISAPPPPVVTRIGIDEVRLTAPDNLADWPGDLSVEMRIRGVFDEVGRLGGADTAVVVDSITMWRQQLFRLVYVTDRNESPPSTPDTTYLAFPPPIKPGVVVLNDHSVELTWQPPTQWNDHEYEVEKRESGDTTFHEVALGDTVWVDENVNFNKRTFYRIRGVSGENIGDFSSLLSARLQMNTVENLQVDKTEDLTVELTWEEPARVSTTYLIQRSINGGEFVTIAELPSTARQYTDTLPERGLDVSYQVVSLNSQGDRIVSDQVSQAVRDVAHGMLLLPSGPRGESWYVDADEVSAAEFARFCEETQRNLPERPDHSTGPYWYEDNYLPAVMVTWDDAVDFCNWRSTSLGLSEAYDDSGNVVNEAGGFRLPDRELYEMALQELGGGLAQAKRNANLLGADDGNRWLAPGLGEVVNPRSSVHLIGNVFEWIQESVGDDGRIALGGAFTTPRAIVNEVPDAAHPRTWYASTIGFRCVLPATVVAASD